MFSLLWQAKKLYYAKLSRKIIVLNENRETELLD